MTNIPLHLPIGPSGLNVSAADLQAVQQSLTVSEFDGGSAPWRTYTFTNTAPPSTWKEIHRISRDYEFRDNHIEFQLPSKVTSSLKKTLGGDIPVPQRIICGPATLRQGTEKATANAETVIADLSGNEFVIKLRDQDGYYLDPVGYFRLFEQLGIWAIGSYPCPFVPLDTPGLEILILNIAGPTPKQDSQPYLRIGGIRRRIALDNKRIIIHNPPQNLPATHFSFITEDQLFVEVVNLPSNAEATFTISQFANAQKKWSKKQTTHRWEFELQNDKLKLRKADKLNITHPKYKGYPFPMWDNSDTYHKTGGSRKKSKALKFKLKVAWGTGNTASVLESTITQDTRDVIRQEYLFHSRPFQPKKKDYTVSGYRKSKEKDGTWKKKIFSNYNRVLRESYLPIPERHQLEQNTEETKPPFATYFTAEDLNEGWEWKKEDKKWKKRKKLKNNYAPWTLNKSELYQVAEYMRRKYAEHLLAWIASASPEETKKIKTYDITINSQWRNPERNEIVSGVHDSNHQFGRALDLKSASRSLVKSKDVKAALNIAMFDAAADFLLELAQLNSENGDPKTGAQKCGGTEILLERNSKQLCARVLDDTGTQILTRRRRKRNSPLISDASLKAKAKIATHVHIAWEPLSGKPPLKLPTPPTYDPLPPSPEPHNLILISSEADETAVEEHLPFMAMAQTIKAHLLQIDSNTPTEIRVVSNPVEYLAACGAIEGVPRRIRYFFSLTHARRGGLTLTNFPKDGSIPYIDPQDGVQIHDSELFERLKEIYDIPIETDEAEEETEEVSEPPPDDDDDDDDENTDEDEAHQDLGIEINELELEIGDNYETEINTHQMRVSNLSYLTPQSKAQMVASFKNTKGVFFIGLNITDTDETEGNFFQAFADTIQQRVQGKVMPAQFITQNQLGKWVQWVGTPNPYEGAIIGMDIHGFNVFLNPNSENPNNKWNLRDRSKPSLLEIYSNLNLLTPYDPQEDADGTH